MAANKFATMLHRNTNKITLILVYALLEWILIALLLLNSLFSYLIFKYTEYFGLKRPCLWCSRLDHFFDSAKSKNSYRDLVCDEHANEISKLGFCSNHRKLSKSEDMCEDCSSSSDLDMFPWLNQIESGDVNFMCSCCGVSLERKKVYSPYLLVNPSWEVLEVDHGIHNHGHYDHDQDRSGFVSNQTLDAQNAFGEKIERELGETEENTCSVCSSEEDTQVEEEVSKKEEEDSIKKDYDLVSSMEIQKQSCDESKNSSNGNTSNNKNEESNETVAKHLEFYIGGDDCHLIPIESRYKFRVKDAGSGNEDVILDFGVEDNGNEVELVMVEKNKSISEETVALLSTQESEKEAKNDDNSEQLEESEWCSFIHAGPGDSVVEEESKEVGNEKIAEVGGSVVEEENKEVENEKITEVGGSMVEEEDDIEAVNEKTAEAGGSTLEEKNKEGEDEKIKEMPSVDSQDESRTAEEMEPDVNQVADDVNQMQSDENDAEISIGTEIPDHEHIYDDIQTEEILSSHPISHEDKFACSSSELRTEEDHHGFMKSEDGEVELKAISTETSEVKTMNENEEEKIPDTPTSIDKKMLLYERREWTAEESIDGGSVLSDIDGGGDGALTFEKLKSALRAERKALHDLYAELEEERSASAVAASQTMAMINRLHEEKAAMQMEALQYQRMMEEQSEYDQEALQLLNELMVKREKEKAELEKELEIYRKRVHEYEAKEKMAMLMRRRSRNSSTSCSNAEDSDGVSVELNNEAKEDDKSDNHEEGIDNQNTPVDAVLYLEESLGIFEEERLSILEQLKDLEEKLFTLNEEEVDEEEEEHHHFEHGNGNGVALTNGNGKHHQERKIKAKRLLPLFDAETDDGVLNGNEIELDSVASHNSSVIKFELDDNKRAAIEEEVDHVYERLLALEADREFLKHCISSLRKGDKGIYLLQEILQHLRDLRDVELRARNMANAAALH